MVDSFEEDNKIPVKASGICILVAEILIEPIF